MTGKGQVFTAYNIGATVDRIAVCAESIALALKERISDLDTIVAVRHPEMENRHVDYEIVPPRGMSRELSTDYEFGIHVIINIDGKPSGVPMKDILPYKYKRCGEQ